MDSLFGCGPCKGPTMTPKAWARLPESCVRPKSRPQLWSTARTTTRERCTPTSRWSHEPWYAFSDPKSFFKKRPCPSALKKNILGRPNHRWKCRHCGGHDREQPRPRTPGHAAPRAQAPHGALSSVRPQKKHLLLIIRAAAGIVDAAVSRSMAKASRTHASTLEPQCSCWRNWLRQSGDAERHTASRRARPPNGANEREREGCSRPAVSFLPPPSLNPMLWLVRFRSFSSSFFFFFLFLLLILFIFPVV